MNTPRYRPATLAVAVVLLLASAATAGAQTTPPAPTTAPTTAPTSAPTTTPPGCLLICPTTAPPTSDGGPKRNPSTTVAAPSTTSPSPGGDGEPPPGTPKVIPPDAQRQIDSVRRTGPNNTDPWLAAIQPLVTEFGMTETDAAIATGVHFPIAGPTSWVDDWLYPRYVPTFHLHKGLDMFAAFGTPVRSPMDGVLKLSEGAVGGLAAYVTTSDGTYYYLAHLQGFAPGKVTGQQVRMGEVVGFVGDSGNARGGAPHVHIQYHPRGGEAAPPKPIVDAWLAEAVANAPQAVADVRAARNPAAPTAPGASVTAVTEIAPGPTSSVATTVDPAAALWAAASNPAIGTIDLASSLVANAADSIDWPKPPT